MRNLKILRDICEVDEVGYLEFHSKKMSYSYSSFRFSYKIKNNECKFSSALEIYGYRTFSDISHVDIEFYENLVSLVFFSGFTTESLKYAFTRFVKIKEWKKFNYWSKFTKININDNWKKLGF